MFDHVATPAEADREYARNYGMDHPDREWVLSDRDVWYRNPSYRGPVGPHPEDHDPDWDLEEGLEVLGTSLARLGAALLEVKGPTYIAHLNPLNALDDLPF